MRTESFLTSKRRCLACVWIALLLALTVRSMAEDKGLPTPRLLIKVEAVPPTLADVPYGDQIRQTLDLWQAPSSKPTPLIFYVHGGGWSAQDKTDIDEHLNVRAFLDAGISMATVNYRLLQDANAAHVVPPIQWPLNDAKRALQFLRSKAGEWNLDKTRIGASGVSAGGGTSLWLALHPEMAEPGSRRWGWRWNCSILGHPGQSMRRCRHT
jgi:acetyl esterase/lipase